MAVTSHCRRPTLAEDCSGYFLRDTSPLTLHCTLKSIYYTCKCEYSIFCYLCSYFRCMH